MGLGRRSGVTHLADDPAAVPAEVRQQGEPDREALRELWDDARGPLDAPPAAGASQGEQRTLRLIRGAVSDLQRGETARAQVALESVLRDEPAQPEAHWYLALLERQRGRYDSAQAHLESFLASAGDSLEPWRSSAKRRLQALADERRLAEPLVEAAATDFIGLAAPHFRVHYDAALGRASPDYARTVLSYLEEARESASERLGTLPREAMGVVLYGKAAYLRAHRHRFSFQTVGFFDGRIHVVSAGHPAGELRALLFHEYTHAVFRERTGGDRPYWLNEGLAETRRAGLAFAACASRAASWCRCAAASTRTAGSRCAGSRPASRGSTTRMRARPTSRRWRPPTGSKRARTAPSARACWRGSARASRDDVALRETVGFDTDAIDAALREQVLREFPERAARDPD